MRGYTQASSAARHELTHRPTFTQAIRLIVAGLLAIVISACSGGGGRSEQTASETNSTPPRNHAVPGSAGEDLHFKIYPYRERPQLVEENSFGDTIIRTLPIADTIALTNASDTPVVVGFDLRITDANGIFVADQHFATGALSDLFPENGPPRPYVPSQGTLYFSIGNVVPYQAKRPLKLEILDVRSADFGDVQNECVAVEDVNVSIDPQLTSVGYNYNITGAVENVSDKDIDMLSGQIVISDGDGPVVYHTSVLRAAPVGFGVQGLPARAKIRFEEPTALSTPNVNYGGGDDISDLHWEITALGLQDLTNSSPTGGFAPSDCGLADSEPTWPEVSNYSVEEIATPVGARLGDSFIMFVGGIGSDAGCSGGDRFRSSDDVYHTAWIEEYLQEDWPRAHLGRTVEFAIYDYSARDDVTEPCADYEPEDTCWSLDNAYRDALGQTRSLRGQAARFADELTRILRSDSDANISIIAHSQGGVLAAYAIHDYLSDETLRKRITAIVTLDSPLGGVSSTDDLLRAGPCGLGAALDQASDSPSDLSDQGPVIRAIHTTPWPNVPLYTVDAAPGLIRIAQLGGASINYLVADDDHASLKGWESAHLSIATDDHNAVFARPDGTTTSDDDRLLQFIGCALTGMEPAEQCSAFE